MSYIKDIRGIDASNPINEIATNYEQTSLANESSQKSISNQNIYNAEPVSVYDTEYYNEHRSKLEQLRTHTESMNMALEAALVPSIIDGYSEQPFEKVEETDNKSNKKMNKKITDTYIFQDHTVPIKEGEYVFKCNMIKFRSDKEKRLIYDRYVHMYTRPGDSVKSLEYSLIFEFNPNMTLELFKELNPHMEKYGWDEEFEPGIEINTGIPSTVYNLYKLGYIQAFLPFINNRAVSWTKATISTDRIDTFIILDISDWYDHLIPSADDRNKLIFKYLDIPFRVDYLRGKTEQFVPDYIYTTSNGEKIYHYPEEYLTKTPIFCISTSTGSIVSDEDYLKQVKNNSIFANGNTYDRIFINDNHIIYEEFYMDSNKNINVTSQLGTLYNKRFTDYDYRFKLKQFNFLCFEESDKASDGYELREDFSIQSHQFNIIKITLERVLTNKRRFKIFYDTRVMYDQDNILRIKNLTPIAEEFERYLIDVNSNVKQFIVDVYDLMSRDIGIYLDKDGNEYKYNHETQLFESKTAIAKKINHTTLNNENRITPVGVGTSMFKKYPDDEYDVLKIRTEIVHFNNMEEGSTPSDEFIYYENKKASALLKDMVAQIFINDTDTVKQTMNNLVDLAHIDRYSQIDPESKKDYRNEWFLRKNLHEMFVYDVSDDYIFDDMSMLDEVFDFTYSDKLSYKENLTNGLEYVIGYDMDKLEATIKRGVVSTYRLGYEIKRMIVEERLTLPRFNIKGITSHVMIFQNGKLYPRHESLVYTDNDFTIVIHDDEISNYDIFEFVFFLNTNNTVIEDVNLTDAKIPETYISTNDEPRSFNTFENGVISCNSSIIAPENLLTMVEVDPYNPFNASIDFEAETTSTAYKIDHKVIYSYETHKGTHYIKEKLNLDSPVNGLYGVTKQGGGEYFIVFDKVSFPIPYKFILCSERQFRYMRHFVSRSHDTYEFDLISDFKYCMNQKQYMIFKNGSLLPPNSIVIHSITKSNIDRPRVYLNVSVAPGDNIDVFYIPNELNLLNKNVENFEESKTNDNGQRLDTLNMKNYIRFKSPMYATSSKHSIFVFINGSKVPFKDLEDISNTIIKITTRRNSRERVEIYSHMGDLIYNEKLYIKDGITNKPYKIDTIDFNDLSTYNDPSKLDKLLNTLSDDTLNTLFENRASSSNGAIKIDQDYLSKTQIINKIKEEYTINQIPNDWIIEV